MVTRADYDAFVKSESDELIDKAKTELASLVSGGEKLIDSTIKTTVVEKVFTQELDQEATQLSGKLTLAVSGISYSEADIRALLATITADKVPTGYAVNDRLTTISVTNVVVKKDGKMTATAQMSAKILPTLDIPLIKNNLAGKSMKNVETYLRTLPGIMGVKVGFSMSPTKAQLPYNRNNIRIYIDQGQ